METIWKYNVAVDDEQALLVPKGSKLLSVKEQYGNLVAYVLVGKGIKETTTINLRIFGTGHPIDINTTDEWKYLDTVMTNKGELVWHVFYKNWV
jgi:hypothetical protein